MNDIHSPQSRPDKKMLIFFKDLVIPCQNIRIVIFASELANFYGSYLHVLSHDSTLAISDANLWLLDSVFEKPSVENRMQMRSQQTTCGAKACRVVYLKEKTLGEWKFMVVSLSLFTFIFWDLVVVKQLLSQLRNTCLTIYNKLTQWILIYLRRNRCVRKKFWVKQMFRSNKWTVFSNCVTMTSNLCLFPLRLHVSKFEIIISLWRRQLARKCPLVLH